MKKQKTPLVSIVMPVYNAAEFLRESLDSILSQTYCNWELIAVDDASSDNSYQILMQYADADSRIKLYKNRNNLGVSKSANKAISKAKGEYIARMDSDDIMFPDRLEKQLKYLQKHDDVLVVGMQCKFVNSRGDITGNKIFPTSFENIKSMMFWSIPMQQPSLMFNRNKLPKNFAWYDGGFTSAEDLELMFKLFKLGKVANMSDFGLYYRIHGGNTSLINPKKTFYLTLKSRIRAVRKHGYKPSLKGLMLTAAQTAIVFIVPNKYIFPLFSVIRGFNKEVKHSLKRIQPAFVS